MQTILYQGKPAECNDWLVLPTDFVPTYRDLGYATRELVLRDDAEQAKVEHFNAAIEQAVTAVVKEFGSVPAAPVAKKLRALKLVVKP